MPTAAPRSPRPSRARTNGAKTAKVVKASLPANVIVLDTATDHAPFEEREPLFALNGVVYEARTNFSASEVLTYGQIGRAQGLDAAVDWAMETALGKDGYRALLDYPYLPRDKASDIIGQVIGRLQSPVVFDPKSPKG